ncbi:hypothetical protein HCU01_05650 [Halomonas cupida]|uniref:Uncharacterized protein n=1 Tax=Halomonas cupida TaxID=44933 RepID=A0ABQ0WAI2_9GAMM|nr:hypothetical protein HCU01_05650 [Halomonas cupida]
MASGGLQINIALYRFLMIWAHTLCRQWVGIDQDQEHGRNGVDSPGARLTDTMVLASCLIRPAATLVRHLLTTTDPGQDGDLPTPSKGVHGNLEQHNSEQ